MGRMKRLRTYKACDPFSKKTKKVSSKEIKYDLPPKNDDQTTRKFQRVQMGIKNPSINMKKRKNYYTNEPDKHALRKSSKKMMVKREDTGMMEKMTNETKNQYFERLDQNVQNAINTTMMETKKIRKKRKEHLKARSEKLKLKKKQTNRDFGSVKEDHVKFGERVDEPPTITSAPRNTPKTSNKYQGLKLMAMVDKKKDKKSGCIDNEKRKVELEEERQRVIDAYRLLKKRKEARLAT